MTRYRGRPLSFFGRADGAGDANSYCHVEDGIILVKL
jgi:hypothetical protein